VDFGLNGRVAVVTGGSRGLGYAIARRLLDEGARVVICGRDGDACRRAVESLGPDAHAETADVSVESDVAALVAAVLDRHGGLDVLVNNAGRFGGGPLDATPDEAWRAGFDVKALGAVHTSTYARAALIASGQGRIVNISGVTSELVVPGVAVTALANSAMTTLTAYLAQDLRAYGVTANCVVPGYTLSEVWQERVDAYAADHGIDAAAARSAILAERGMGADARWGTPDELAAVVAFLASAPASYVSGATLRVDGAQLPVVSHP
jgi:NAD(P)-dependent dehydrogenase (short-subunit alcohol dehydrogenase family)